MEARFKFTKMSGCGNDFIFLDHRDVPWNSWDLPKMARLLCRRRLSVGADGFVLLLPPEDPDNDFAWRFFNSDGSEAEMCGNAARCAARFAVVKGLVAKERMRFETISGVVEAQLTPRGAKIWMTEPKEMRPEITVILEEGAVEMAFLNTGVPHAVVFVEDLEEIRVEDLGRKIRYHEAFYPKGTNVDFVQMVGSQALAMRTYERGVEGETLACGTGAVASAIAGHMRSMVRPPVTVKTRGGELKIDFQFLGEGRYENVTLEGDARIIYEGIAWEEALLE
jgi:diaminopimelate epimerase